MTNSLNKIITDKYSGSLIITKKTLAYFRDVINECIASEQASQDCYATALEASKAILKSQPNMALLRHCNTNFLSFFKRVAGADHDKHKSLSAALDKLLQIEQEVEKNLDRIAVIGSKLITSSNNVMTISYSTIVRQIFVNAHKLRKRYQVFNLKSHPPDEGIHLAEFLTDKKIKTTLIADSEMGVFMPEMNLVIVGADRVYEDGFVNKAGTLPLLLTAKHFNVPVYLATETWKILLERDKAVKFIERDISEIYDNDQQNVQVQNYYFERIPLDLVTKVICEEGVFESNEFADWYLKD